MSMESSKFTNGTIFIMVAVLVAGTISMVMPTSFAEPSDQKFNKDPYTKDHYKKSSGISVQKIKCINFNFNLNGIDINPEIGNNIGTAEAQTTQDGVKNENGVMNGNGNDGINTDKNLVNICVNVNINNQDDMVGNW